MKVKPGDGVHAGFTPLPYRYRPPRGLRKPKEPMMNVRKVHYHIADSFSSAIGRAALRIALIHLSPLLPFQRVTDPLMRTMRLLSYHEEILSLHVCTL